MPMKNCLLIKGGPFMKKVGLIPNMQKEEALQLTNELCEKFKSHGIEVFLTPESKLAFENNGTSAPSDIMAKNAELLVVLGGDGTLLKVARDYAGHDIPILGINVGKVGFLTEIEVGEINGHIKDIIDGKFEVNERMMLEGRVIRDGKDICKFKALNDIVINKGPFSKLIELETKVDGNFLETYPGDGLIVSTSTGSTGYSLSAGGPIVNPEVQALIITPICPHILHDRSVIISPHEVININVKTNYSVVVLTVDGQQGFTLQEKDIVEIKKAACKTKLVKCKNRSFYNVLNHKLRERKE